MNILLVNPAHPSTAHISAVRAWRFAEELASFGHRVVLLTALPKVAGQAPFKPMGPHDWRQPLVVAPAAYTDVVPAVGNALLRKMRTAWQLLRNGGHQSDWTKAAVTEGVRIGREFRPDVIWATYGKMEALIAAKRLSKRLGAPWVMDLKDNWRLFVPRPLWQPMGWRVRGWHAITANAQFTASQARHFHGSAAAVVYSGVDAAFFDLVRASAHAEDTAVPGFTINLIGSLYYADRLQVLMDGVAEWSAGLPEHERQRARLNYIGGDVEMFERAVAASGVGIDTQATGYLQIERLAASVHDAEVNMYVTHDGSFHHKLLELLVCNRPIIVYPCESAESHALVKQVGGELLEPGDAKGVARALADLLARSRKGPAQAHIPHSESCLQYSWPSQARLLEEVLTHVARTA